MTSQGPAETEKATLSGSWVTLAPDETVVWTGHPSPYLVKFWIGVALGVLAVGLFALWLLPADWDLLGWLVVAGAAAVGLYAVVAYRSVRYVVTTEKVYRKRGILRKNVDTVRLGRIQNVSFSQSIPQRLANCGDMKIDTAGSGRSEIVFQSVPNPERVNGLVVDRIGGATADSAGGGT